MYVLMAGAGYFYGLTAACMGAKVALYLAAGRTLYDGRKWTYPRSYAPVPRLLPTLGGREPYLALLGTMLAVFAAAAVAPDVYALRVAAALVHAGFSASCACALEWGHGQYVVLWSSVGMLLPAPWAVAVARGAVCYLYVAAGLAKVCVPATPAEYLAPATMRALLTADGSTPRFRVVAWPALFRAIVGSDAALRAVACGTLALELAVVPLTFLAPRPWRLAAMALCLLFHAGIAASFTVVAGTMFFQLSGCYSVAFASNALALGSAPWWCGVALGAAPALSLLTRGHPYAMGERWPATNCALFPWSATQLEFLERLRGGTTRLCFTAAPATDAELIGSPLIGRGQKAAPERGALEVHDSPGNAWNWTKVYPDFVDALNASLREPGGFDAAAARLAPRAQAWLRRDEPLYQTSNDRPLAVAYLVELDAETKLIRRVVKRCHGDLRSMRKCIR